MVHEIRSNKDEVKLKFSKYSNCSLWRSSNWGRVKKKGGGYDFNPFSRARDNFSALDIVKSVILAKHQVSFSLGGEGKKKKYETKVSRRSFC